MDYSLYYRAEIKSIKESGSWDIFISAYNSSERVNRTFNEIDAERKIWLILPEYNFKDADVEALSEKYVCPTGNEASQLLVFLKTIEFKKLKVCIDATGFIRPQLLFILAYLHRMKISCIDFIYSEPAQYKGKEHTEFSKGTIAKPRQVLGYAGCHIAKEENDIVIIGCGYDSNLISKSAQYKDNALKVAMLGFPSLLPDMYQENILSTLKSFASLDLQDRRKYIYAPASDPFATAKALSEFFKLNPIGKFDNIYLSPLSTKAQVLGMGLFYLRELDGRAASIIYPVSEYYAQETGVGIGKMWRYTFEFDL